MALLGAGCTRCGRTYPAEAIRVLAQREAIAFVQLDCTDCDIQTLALVTGIPLSDEDDHELAVDRAAEEGRHDTLTRGSARPARGLSADRAAAARDEAAEGPDDPPISDSDVDEMRSFLAGYRGDLRSLVDRRERGGGAGRR